MIPFCEMNYFENFGFSEYLVVFYTFSANGSDPTNGTVSSGDIMRVGGSFMSGNWDRNAQGAGPSGPESK